MSKVKDFLYKPRYEGHFLPAAKLGGQNPKSLAIWKRVKWISITVIIIWIIFGFIFVASMFGRAYSSW